MKNQDQRALQVATWCFAVLHFTGEKIDDGGLIDFLVLVLELKCWPVQQWWFLDYDLTTSKIFGTGSRSSNWLVARSGASWSVCGVHAILVFPGWKSGFVAPSDLESLAEHSDAKSQFLLKHTENAFSLWPRQGYILHNNENCAT